MIQAASTRDENQGRGGGRIRGKSARDTKWATEQVRSWQRDQKKIFNTDIQVKEDEGMSRGTSRCEGLLSKERETAHIRE